MSKSRRRSSNRRTARQIVVQLLHAEDLNPRGIDEQTRQFLSRELDFPELEAFALERLEGIARHRSEIDEILRGSAQNWRLERMAVVDRAILRLATYEILYCRDAPPRVAIDEAIELAKLYSTADSPGFVNGILDRVMRLRSSEPEAAAEDAPPTPPAEPGS